MEPEKIDEFSFDYVYARCRCCNPIEYAIKIPKEPGKTRYHFKCDKCGTEGEVIIKYI